MSTLKPRPPYSEEELADLYPASLKLEQVQVLFRHGERTPVTVRFQNANVPPFWNFCTAASQFRAAVLENADLQKWGTLPFRRQVETFGQKGKAVMTSSRDGKTDGICLFGELTDKGRETTLQLGQRLRQLYVDRLGFLPHELVEPRQVYLRASPVPRALESMQQVLTGLYPPESVKVSEPLNLITRNVADENLFPNDHNCRRYLQLSRLFADVAAQKWNSSEEMKYIQSKVGKWTDGPVAVDGHPRLSGIQDHINSTAAHDKVVHLPKEFYDEKLREYMDKITVDEWFGGYNVSSEFRRLGVGSLIGDIAQRMVSSIGKPEGEATKLQLGLMGAHDTTLAGVLASLGAYDWRWPPYTSSIAFELFRSTSEASQTGPRNSVWGWKSWFGRGKDEPNVEGYYVRVRYNDKPVVLKGCKGIGKHLDGNESFCTLAAFKEIAEKLTPADWRMECRSNLDKQELPPVEEVE